MGEMRDVINMENRKSMLRGRYEGCKLSGRYEWCDLVSRRERCDLYSR